MEWRIGWQLEAILVAAGGLSSSHEADWRACFVRRRSRTRHEAQRAIGYDPMDLLMARRSEMGAETS